MVLEMQRQLGIGFVFGHFINPKYKEIAMKRYYEDFKPSVNMKEPSTIVCIFVVCAETDEAKRTISHITRQMVIKRR